MGAAKCVSIVGTTMCVYSEHCGQSHIAGCQCGIWRPMSAPVTCLIPGQEQAIIGQATLLGP